MEAGCFNPSIQTTNPPPPPPQQQQHQQQSLYMEHSKCWRTVLWLMWWIMLLPTARVRALTTKTATTFATEASRTRTCTARRIRRQPPPHNHDFHSAPVYRHQRISWHFSSLDDFLEGSDFDRLLRKEEQQQQQQMDSGSIDTPISSGWKKLPDIPKGNDSSFSLQNAASNTLPPPSPVEQRTIGGRTMWIKRDDLRKLPNSGISGNKARKMWTLDQIPSDEFLSCIVSYGGPQSNSMLALAAIVHSKNRMRMGDNQNDDNGASAKSPAGPIRFVYYTKTLPRFLRNQPNGNLFRALSLGMELIELTPQEYGNLFEEHYEQEGEAPLGLAPPVPGDSVWVPQGGAFASAHAGTLLLAQEIFSFWKEKGKGRPPLTVCVPSGTCTTALLLHHGLKQLAMECDDNDDCSEPMDIEVVVIPCVGDETYARRQMMALSSQIGEKPEDIPTILSPSPIQDDSSELPQKYFVFAQPNREILETFQQLQDEHNLVVDLIYGAPSFAILLRHLKEETELLSPDLLFDPFHPLRGREIMYVHSGGLEGINSQLLRYKYEGMVEVEDVQLPGKAGKK